MAGWPVTATERSYLGQVGPEVAPDDFLPLVASAWARPAEVPENDDPFFGSPTAYNLVFAPPGGRFPTGFVRHVGFEELAAVELDVAAVSPGRHARLISIGQATALGFGNAFDGVSFRTPARRTEYFTTEVTSVWQHVLLDEDARLSVNELSNPLRVPYEAGRTYRARWNHGVLAPSFPTEAGRNPTFFRADSFLVMFDPSLLSDDAEHRGRPSLLDEERARLFRDGELVEESTIGYVSAFFVPPEDHEYRLELETVRDAQADRSTRVTTAWTFRSATTPFAALPLLTVRYQPSLDRRHRAPGGVPFVVPLSIQREVDSVAAPLRRLRVEASYDGGESWHRALVIRSGDRGFALLLHPAGGTVSLRSRAEDEAGRSMEQTIVDAYHLR
jgi:hypothetical protein